MISRTQLAKMIDHSLLKAYASPMDFEQCCADAIKNGFMMVAVNSCQVKQCKRLLGDSPVRVGAAIGFPLGQSPINVKVFETLIAIIDGADEIDYVINITELKAGNLDYVKDEMEQIVSLCRQYNVTSKVIFENCYLSIEEIKTVALIASEVKPDYVKTSTGFGQGGATIEDVILMRDTLKGTCQIKAAGGIKNWDTCKMMINAGSTRIGTAYSLEILAGFDEEQTREAISN